MRFIYLKKNNETMKQFLRIKGIIADYILDSHSIDKLSQTICVYNAVL